MSLVCYELFSSFISWIFLKESFLCHNLWSIEMFCPAVFRQDKGCNRNISGFLYLGDFIWNSVYLRISILPKLIDFGRTFLR